MKRASLKEKLYTQYQLLKSEVTVNLRLRNGSQVRTPRATRKTIKWRSKGY